MTDEVKAKITVIGVGGAGGNAMGYMMEKGIAGVRYIAVNTDREGLDHSKAETKILMGCDSEEGMGTFGKPQAGKDAAMGSRQAIKEAIYGSNLVLIIAGLGGGTGTGAAPVIAEICRDAGISLTVPIVSMPCSIEGKKRAEQARQGLITLQTIIDSVIVISCDHVRCSVDKSVTIAGLFNKVDECLYYATKGITDHLMRPGIVCRDFADMRGLFSLKGLVCMGTGTAPGVKETVENAINQLHSQGVDPNDAKGVLFSIDFGTTDFQSEDLYAAADVLYNHVCDDSIEIFWGDIFNEIDEVRAIVFALGLPPDSIGFETESPGEVTLPKPHIVARYADIIHHLNSRIERFNTFLKNDLAFPRISVDNRDTYTDALRSDGGPNEWPGKNKHGVYVFCLSHDKAGGKLGVYIGKASVCKMGHRMYGHLNLCSEGDTYKTKWNNEGYILEAILAVPIQNDSSACLASALEEYLITGGVPGVVLMNAVAADTE